MIILFLIYPSVLGGKNSSLRLVLEAHSSSSVLETYTRRPETAQNASILVFFSSQDRNLSPIIYGQFWLSNQFLPRTLKFQCHKNCFKSPLIWKSLRPQFSIGPHVLLPNSRPQIRDVCMINLKPIKMFSIENDSKTARNLSKKVTVFDWLVRNKRVSFFVLNIYLHLYEGT